MENPLSYLLLIVFMFLAFYKLSFYLKPQKKETKKISTFYNFSQKKY